jgi:hypothetical protein
MLIGERDRDFKPALAKRCPVCGMLPGVPCLIGYGDGITAPKGDLVHAERVKG